MTLKRYLAVRLMLTGALVFTILGSLGAQTKTFLREYKYMAGEADSKLTARAIALDQVKKMLLEETGVYLQDTFTKDKSEALTGDKSNVTDYSKDQLTSITAGVTQTKVDTEIWTGSTYYIKAEITLNIEDVKQKINALSSNQTAVKGLEDNEKKTKELESELQELRDELKSTKSDMDRIKIQKTYEEHVSTLTAKDWYDKGTNADQAKNTDSAIVYYGQAIEADPKFTNAYIGLGNDYYYKGSYDLAIDKYLKITEYEPSNTTAYNNLGLAYNSKTLYDRSIEYLNKAVSIDPSYTDAYLTLGVDYYSKSDYPKAIEMYNKVLSLKADYDLAYHDLG